MLDLKIIQQFMTRYGEQWGAPVQEFDIGGHQLAFNTRTSLMGVINLSTDSWYQESICRSASEAVARGNQLVAQGAAIVDIGAESTLPDAGRVDAKDQQELLLPVVKQLCAQGVLVSVESYYPEVLDAAARAGARLFNLTGIREETEVLKLARAYDAAVIFCYVQGETPHDVHNYQFAEDSMEELVEFFSERTSRARATGVHRCILDPGLGFYYGNLQDGALRVRHQLTTLLHSRRLNQLGFPVLNILPHAPEIFVEPLRRSAEPFFAVLALMAGSHLLRTHEVEAVHRVRQALSVFGDQGESR